MTLEPLPYYKWLVRDYRANRKVQRMGYLAKGFYRELLDEAWLEGSLPIDFDGLAEICGCPAKVIEKVWPEIAPCFEERDGRLYNAKLENQRTAIDAARVKMAESGAVGGKKSNSATRVGKPTLSPPLDDIKGTQAKPDIAEQSRSRAEKSREEKETPAKDKPSQFALPLWVRRSTWDCFEEMRRRIRKPLTDRARQNILAKLDEFRGRGHDPEEVLNNSISNSWTGIWEPLKGGERGFSGQGGSSNRGQARSDANNEAARRAIDSILRGSTPGVSGSETGDSGRYDVQAVRAASGGV